MTINCVLKAALATAAIAPATAAAIPPDNLGAPLGSQAACAAATPTGTTLPTVGPVLAAIQSRCNLRAASGSIGYGVVTNKGMTLTHIQKTNVCTVGNDGIRRVTGYAATTFVDVSKASTGVTHYEDSAFPFVAGRTYTLTILGTGAGVAGGPSTPGAESASEPATPGPSDWTGAEDLSSPLQTPC